MEVRCQCNSINFKTPLPSPAKVYHCHCNECRLQSASAYGTTAIFPIFPISEELSAKLSIWTRPTASGKIMDCYFCKICGVRILHRARSKDGKPKETISIKGGCIQGLDWTNATHIWTKEAVVPIPDNVEKWDGEPLD